MSASPTLLELQTELSRIVTDPAGVQDVLVEIRDDARASPKERLSVYSEAYFARILASLADDFSALVRAMEDLYGEGAFARLVAEYLSEYPSRFDRLQSVGFALPTFLRQRALAEPDGWVELTELAELEWKVMESFYADSASPRGTCPVSECRPQWLIEKPLVLNPTLRLQYSKWDVDLFRGKQVQEMSESNRFIEVVRIGGAVRVSAIDENEFKALELASQGTPLSGICESFQDSRQDSRRGLEPDEIRQWTSRWVVEGILRGVRAL